MSVQGADNGKHQRVYFRADHETRTKKCPRCMKTKGFDEFYEHINCGRRRISSYCRQCFVRQCTVRYARKRTGPPRRMPRYNAAGDAWCPNCKAYLNPASFRPHPTRPGKLWAYCIPCVREMDRMRYQYGDRRQQKASQDVRTRRRAARRRQELANRAEFVRMALSTLGRRGFTNSDIAAICRFDHGGMVAWQRGERIPHPAMERTLGELLVMTAGYATDRSRPPHSRAHPDRARLAAEMSERWPALGRKRRKGGAE